MAQEADGSVKFGQGDGSAYLFDPDIYTDGRISVQGIDGVLFPPEEETKIEKKTGPLVKVVSKPRRGNVILIAIVMCFHSFIRFLHFCYYHYCQLLHVVCYVHSNGMLGESKISILVHAWWWKI